MKKTQNDSSNPSAGSMSNQKTNEDFNKKRPDPNDPNQTNDIPDDFGEQGFVTSSSRVPRKRIRNIN